MTDYPKRSCCEITIGRSESSVVYLTSRQDEKVKACQKNTMSVAMNNNNQNEYIEERRPLVRLFKGTADLDGTCYYEFFPGKQKEFWQEESVYVEEDILLNFSFILEKNIPDYDYYDCVVVSQKQASAIATDLLEFSCDMQTTKDLTVVRDKWHLPEWKWRNIKEEWGCYQNELVVMAKELGEWFLSTANKVDCISIIGM